MKILLKIIFFYLEIQDCGLRSRKQKISRLANDKIVNHAEDEILAQIDS